MFGVECTYSNKESWPYNHIAQGKKVIENSPPMSILKSYSVTSITFGQNSSTVPPTPQSHIILSSERILSSCFHSVNK